MYKAEILADSMSPQGDRLTTMKITFPRIVLAEFNTHRMFSRNSASSRAIPFKKMVQMVQENPFIPLAWQRDHKGMQGTEYLTGEEDKKARQAWSIAKNSAIERAKLLHTDGVTKQLCNRLLEPFMWHTVIVTATEWENFFKLRCPQYETKFGTFYSKKDARNTEIDITDRNPNIGILESPDLDDTLSWLELNKSQAEIHIQAIAELMWDAYNESKPKELKPGEWHIPFGDKFDKDRVAELYYEVINGDRARGHISSIEETKIKIATARCARVSYMNFEGKDDYEADIRLHDRLLAEGHMSPFEHVARVMGDEEYKYFVNGDTANMDWDTITGWCRNFRGFIQYRHLIENN